MGVTIHYRLGQRKEFVPKMLDRVEAYVKTLATEIAPKAEVSFEYKRDHPYRLTVMIGGCEWLCIGFGSLKHWQGKQMKEGYSYEMTTLPRVFPEKELAEESMMWCSAFCKTQYAEKLVEHKFVADILKNVASYCEYANVYDEGDYYHTGRLEDAAEAIGANAEMIANLGKQLESLGYENDQIIKGGETSIKPLKKKDE